MEKRGEANVTYKFALNERDRSEIAERVVSSNARQRYPDIRNPRGLFKHREVRSHRRYEGSTGIDAAGGKGKNQSGKIGNPSQNLHCEWQSSIRIIRRLVLQSTIVAVIRYASAHIGFGALTRSATAGTHHPGSRPLIRVDPVSIGMHERDFSFFVDSARGFDPRED